MATGPLSSWGPVAESQAMKRSKQRANNAVRMVAPGTRREATGVLRRTRRCASTALQHFPVGMLGLAPRIPQPLVERVRARAGDVAPHGHTVKSTTPGPCLDLRDQAAADSL